MIDLWVDKYRPIKLANYIWSSEALRKKALEWVADRCTPHLLFSGTAGTGKTSLARAILREIGIPKVDILFINASGKARKVDELEAEVESFCNTWASNDTQYKYVILDEADRLTPNAQDFLKALIEKYSDSVRFILTANNRAKLITPLHSRLNEYIIKSVDMNDAVMKLVDILDAEKVTFDPEVLMSYVEASFPDMRKCISLLQNAAVGGVLSPLTAGVGIPDYLTDMVALVKQGRMHDARVHVVENARIDDYQTIFTFLYQNLSVWSEDPEKQVDALLIIRDGIVDHETVFDPEINLAAVLACLMRLNTN